ncbi:MAG: DUF917 domain-containing protein [Chloroflexota bacterium]|jgi:hypothetical protein
MDEWIVVRDDVEPLLEGLTILGTGGGGAPGWGRAILLNELARGREMRIVDPQAIADDARVSSGGIMGSTKIIDVMSIEEVVESWEDDFVLLTAFGVMAEHLGGPLDHVVPFEVGGLNTPVIMSLCARLGIPMIDGDALGRSAPETQMTSFIGHNIPLTPMPLADALGNAIVVTQSVEPTYADEIGRWVVTQGGGLGGNSHYPMTGRQLKEAVIPNTVSLARNIGQAVLEARDSSRDPVSAAARELKGRHLFTGTITTLEEREQTGFYLTVVTLAGSGEWSGRKAELTIKNEVMLYQIDGQLAVIFPDLVCMLDPVTGRGLMSTELREGSPVALIGTACHPRLRRAAFSPQGQKSFSPARFGRPDLVYRPMEELGV